MKIMIMNKYKSNLDKKNSLPSLNVKKTNDVKNWVYKHLSNETRFIGHPLQWLARSSGRANHRPRDGMSIAEIYARWKQTDYN